MPAPSHAGARPDEARLRLDSCSSSNDQTGFGVLAAEVPTPGQQGAP